MPQPGSRSALAIVAHPDDIEFVMAGTLLLLAKQGWTLHYFNVANGCCGSMTTGRAETASIRLQESKNAASKLPAHFHPPICDDLAIFYDADTLARVASVVRQANPTIVLTHSPIDYMEDHQNTCRLAVTASFSKNMPNFPTIPNQKETSGDVAVYHAQPHGNQDPFGQTVLPQFAVDIASVIEHKKELLLCHESQQGWLDTTQKMSSYIESMLALGKDVARLVGREGYCEGWRRRNPIGFGPSDWNPLQETLANFVISPPSRDPISTR